jgi:hypothetical protein
MQRAAFLLECLANGVILKGQMLVDEARRMIVFVGSPVINDRSKIRAFMHTEFEAEKLEPVN